MILQVDIEKPNPGVAVVRFTGALTLGTSLHAADAQLQKTINDGAAKVVLDMAAVPYMDSAGLGTLVQASGMAKQQGGDLRLCASVGAGGGADQDDADGWPSADGCGCRGEPEGAGVGGSAVEGGELFGILVARRG